MRGGGKDNRQHLGPPLTLTLSPHAGRGNAIAYRFSMSSAPTRSMALRIFSMELA